jgi:hypothetical protein
VWGRLRWVALPLALAALTLGVLVARDDDEPGAKRSASAEPALWALLADGKGDLASAGSGTLYLFGGTPVAVGPRPAGSLRSNMPAFRRPRTAEDDFPHAALARPADLIFGPGVPRLAESRLLLRAAALYGIPAGRRICLVQAGLGDPTLAELLGCFDRYGWSPSAESEGGTHRMSVVGIVPLEIGRVEVVVDGRRREAALAGGVFLWEGRVRKIADSVSRLLLHDRDGGTRSLPAF